jgi:hypothetical protein
MYLKRAILPQLILWQHAVAFTSHEEPSPTDLELLHHAQHGAMRTAIRIRLKSNLALHSLARINYGEIYLVKKRIKINELGAVHPDYLRTFSESYEQVHSNHKTIKNHAFQIPRPGEVVLIAPQANPGMDSADGEDDEDDENEDDDEDDDDSIHHSDDEDENNER